MPMYLYLGDITRMETDAIVNAAGTDLRRCPGICDAIFAAADTEKLERACRKLGRCRIGQAVATPGCWRSHSSLMGYTVAFTAVKFWLSAVAWGTAAGCCSDRYWVTQ